MSVEVNNAELYGATKDIVGDIFGVESDGARTISTVIDNVYDLDLWSVGSVTNGDDELLIQLGKAEIDQFVAFFDLVDEDVTDIYRYISASMFAGNLIANSAVDPNRRFTETGEVFTQMLVDQTRIVELLKDSVLRGATGSLEAPELVLREIAKRDPLEIATINMHSIGSGILLLAESKLGDTTRALLSAEMGESLDENIKKQTENAQIAFGAAGFRTNYAKSRIAHRVLERLIKQRGIGFAFPYSEQELKALKVDLEQAGRVPDERELIQRGELADEQSTQAWKEMVELSGGHNTVDLDHMHVVETNED